MSKRNKKTLSAKPTFPPISKKTFLLTILLVFTVQNCSNKTQSDLPKTQPNQSETIPYDTPSKDKTLAKLPNPHVQRRNPQNLPPNSYLKKNEPSHKIILISIDSLHPDYIDMNALASGPGEKGDWLMPNVREFTKQGAYWPKSRAYFPQATDMNHLNILASTNSGTTGVVGVSQQPEQWGYTKMKLGDIHLAKAKYPDGSQVETVFDLMKNATGGKAKTAFIGNKGWVPPQYGAAYGRQAAVDIIVNGDEHPDYVAPPTCLSAYDNPNTDPDYACDPESIFQTFIMDS